MRFMVIVKADKNSEAGVMSGKQLLTDMMKFNEELFVSAGITLVATVAFMGMLPYDGKFGPGVLAGLFGRFLVISYLGWLVTVGLYALKLHKQTADHKDASTSIDAKR